MGDMYVVAIYHHGGEFVRHPNGELEYANGNVDRLDDYELDIDKLNFRDLKTLCESLGYRSFKDLFWYDITAPELETGLNKITGDEGIRELIDWLRDNMEKEFHIYIEHVVNQPILADMPGEKNAETVNLADSGSSSDDGYESAEDEAYKPPP
ncbi:hypothetical protein PIB30_113915, partial [Stylosanthes scabra]|nr:hypothetical protein [Stylosanthes scabra]